MYDGVLMARSEAKDIMSLWPAAINPGKCSPDLTVAKIIQTLTVFITSVYRTFL